MKRAGLGYIVALILVGCSSVGDGIRPPNGTPREISGEEALQLYGAVTEDPALIAPMSTPLYFFPAPVWILPNEIPYDPDETITILPMFTRPTLNDGGTWLGDLEAGTEVILQAVDAERTACLVEGITLQGWSTQGWVACNRLSYSALD